MLIPLIEVRIPANTQVILEKLTRICAFEVIPTDQIYINFSTVQGRPINTRFEDLGFEHHLFMENFGTLGFIFAIMPLFYLLHFCTKFFRSCKYCRRLSYKLNRRLYYGYLLRLIIESYIIGWLCCLINFVSMDLFEEADGWTRLNEIITILAGITYILFPIVGTVILLVNFKHLKDDFIQIKYGEMMLGLSLEHRSSVVYWAANLVRRAFLAFIYVYG